MFVTKNISTTSNWNGFENEKSLDSSTGGGIKIVVGSSECPTVKSTTFWRAKVKLNGPIPISLSWKTILCLRKYKHKKQFCYII